jgi:sugar/nucleoside kinase (ribokinase family)
MSKRDRAIVAGHICLDIIPEFDPLSNLDFKTIFQPGGLTKVGPVIFSTGGSVSNTGLILDRLGIPTKLAAKIGDDLFGQAIQQILARIGKGLEKGISINHNLTTSYTVIISPPRIDRLFLHCPGANDDFDSKDIPFEDLINLDLFHFGYPPMMRRIYQNDGEELQKIFQLAKETGITTSLDLCMPDLSTESGKVDWERILKRTLPYVDIFVPSLDETLFMVDRQLYEDYQGAFSPKKYLASKSDLLSKISSRLLEMGAKIVMLKLGDCGAYLRTSEISLINRIGRARPNAPEIWADRELWVPCFRVNVIGTTGSGDSTIAGFLSAFLYGYTPEKALTSAVAVGACNVEAADALSGVPAWDLVQKRIEAGWERLMVCENPVGWHWSKENEIWIGVNDSFSDRQI